MIPTSLRTMADRDMPSTNRVSMVFLDRRPNKLASPQDLLEYVRREMDLIKRYQLGISLVQGIRMIRAIPGALKRMLSKDHCMATAVLTNVGNLTRFFPLPRRNGQLVAGDAVIESIEGFPPFRSRTHAAMGTYTYAKRLYLGLSYDAGHLREADARELLDRYVERIRRSIAEALGPDQSAPFLVRASEESLVRAK
jgi:hypothetical protein